MKNLLILLVTAVALVGCSSSSEDAAATPAKPGEGQPLNPSGKPQTPEAQAMGDKMSVAGKAQEAAQGAAAQQAAAAMKKAGK